MAVYNIGYTLQIDGMTYRIIDIQGKDYIIRNDKGETYHISITVIQNILRGKSKRLKPKIGDVIYIDGLGLCMYKAYDKDSKYHMVVTKDNVEINIPHVMFCRRRYHKDKKKYTVGDKLYTQDGVPFVVTRIWKDETGKKLVEFLFENNIREVYNYTSSLSKMKYSVIEKKYGLDLIGKERVTLSGERYNVIRKLENDRYEVEFTNGVVKDFIRASILRNSISSKTGIYVGKKYTSRDGDLCEVVSVDKETGVTIRRLKDNVEKTFAYSSIISHGEDYIRFERKKRKEEIYPVGYRGKSSDGVGFEVIKRWKEVNSYATIKFDNGEVRDVTVYSLKRGNIVSSEPKKITILGEEWKVIDEDTENRKYRIQNKLGEETEIGIETIRYREIKTLKVHIGDKRSIKGLGLVTVIERDQKTGYIVEDVSNKQRYSLCRESFYKKRFGRKDIQRICNIKLTGRVTDTEFLTCECKKCGMRDILTYDEIMEHWRKCRNS